MRAKDIMTKNVIYAKLDETIKDVSKKMLENKISGLPVIDDDGKIVGVISQTDIVKLSEKYSEEKLKNLKLEDILRKKRKKIIVARLNTPLKKLIELMIRYDVSRIPIIDNNKKVIGIVTKSDVLKIFLEETKEKEIEEKISTLIDKILKILEEKKVISVSELAKELKESEEYLEKNLKILEKYGLIELNYSLGKIIIKKK